MQYVGRTINVDQRGKAHKKNPFRSELKFKVIQSGLTYEQARGIEQVYMLQYHTLNTKNKMNNQINGISPINSNIGVYKEAALGVLRYVENQLSNEILNWLGK